MPGLDEILQDIENLIDYKIELKISEHRLNVESIGSSLSQFENVYMSELEGNDLLCHTTLRSFIRYQEAYNNYHFNTDSNTVLSQIRYLTPQPKLSLSEGELPAIVQNLVLTGTGILPIAATVTPNNIDFDFTKNIIKGQWAYNETDDKWYYVSLAGVKELKIGSDNTEIINSINILSTSITTNAKEIALKASSKSVTDLGVIITAHEAAIILNAENINLKVSTNTFNTLGQRVSTNEADIVINSNSITSKVSQQEFDLLGILVGQQGTSITQTAQSISSLATQESVNSLSGDINTLTSTIEQTATRFSVLLNSDDSLIASFIIESINNESTVNINADKITLTGGVTFEAAIDSKLSTDELFSTLNDTSKTTIDGGRITANTITTLGKIESFNGLYVSDPSITVDDKRVFGVDYSNSNDTYYPRLFLGRKKTTSISESGEGFVVERDSYDNKYKFFLGNDSNYIQFDGTLLHIFGASMSVIEAGVTQTLYSIVNGTIVFNLPVASKGDIISYSSLGYSGSFWDNLSTHVDNISLQYVGNKLSVIDGKYLKLNSASTASKQIIYGDVEIHGNVVVKAGSISASGTITPNTL